MAIQKIPVHGADITDTILSLLVPTYFDSYEESGTAGTYALYKGSTAIATVTGYGRLSLKYNNGASTMQNFGSEEVCDYIYSCSNGLAFESHRINFDASINCFLTKDNNGNPCMVASNPTSSISAYAVTYNSMYYSISPPLSTATLSQVTSLAPVVLNDDHGSYCPNAFIMVYHQSNVDIFDIAGTKYISNGCIALKDE